MARTPMGGTSGDTVVQKDPVSGDYEPADGSKKLDVYTAYTGGTHVTDLQTPSGTAITYLSLGAGIDSNTGIADFLSKDGDQIDYYLQDQDNPTWARVLVRPKTLTAMVAGSGVSSIKLGSGGTPLTGPVEIDLADLVTLGVAPKASPAFSGTPTGLTKSHVGLGNVDNTSDANKPVSTAADTRITALEVSVANLDTGDLTGFDQDVLDLVDDANLVIFQASDGTWPARSSVTGDATVPVLWKGYAGLSSAPSIGGSGAVNDIDDYEAA